MTYKSSQAQVIIKIILYYFIKMVNNNDSETVSSLKAILEQFFNENLLDWKIFLMRNKKLPNKIEYLETKKDNVDKY